MIRGILTQDRVSEKEQLAGRRRCSSSDTPLILPQGLHGLDVLPVFGAEMRGGFAG